MWYIKANALEKKLRQKLKRFIKKRSTSSVYNGDLPAGNDGLGLYLLGVTGDQVLPADVYNEIKVRTLQVRGTVQADILKKIKRKIPVFSLLNLHCD
jgi:methylmalonyl-CoA mutase